MQFVVISLLVLLLRSRLSSGDCEEWDGMAQECRANSCFYCCSDDYCYPNKDVEGASDCLMTTPCTNFCQDDELCSANGCEFNYETNKCSGDVHKTRRYSANLCGPGIVNNNSGIWYTKADFPFPPIPDGYHKVLNQQPGVGQGFFCLTNDKLQFNGKSSKEPSSPSVYQTQFVVACTKSPCPFATFSLPVFEGGQYKLNLHFAEIWKSVPRKMAVTLQDLQPSKNVSTSKIGVPVNDFLEFSVTDDLKAMSYRGISKPADVDPKGEFSRWKLFPFAIIVLKLETADMSNNNNAPILNAFYIEKK